MKYNWELPDWPNFSFNLETIQSNLYKFAEEVGLVSGLLKATNQDSHDEILVQTILVEALKTSEIENEYLSELGVFPFLGEGRNVNYQVMKDLYSVVIAPPQHGIEYVAKLKDELYAKIGWYNSRNSKAHITICEFTADEDELANIVEHLKQIVSYEKPIYLSFNGVDRYPNGAVFLNPNENTKMPLSELMIRIHKKLNLKNSYKSKDPHISIGRKLNEENVEVALKMFAKEKLEFECKNLLLRKFNPQKKQYERFSEEFPFLGTPPKPNSQQSLF